MNFLEVPTLALELATDTSTLTETDLLPPTVALLGLTLVLKPPTDGAMKLKRELQLTLLCRMNVTVAMRPLRTKALDDPLLLRLKAVGDSLKVALNLVL